MAAKILTTGDVATYCGVNVITVLNWIQKGLLRAYKLPGRGDHRIEADDFIHFLKSNAMPVPKEFLVSDRRVLICEDDPPMAKAIDLHLKKAGFETFVALDGFVGGASLLSFRPTVVTLDLLMPGLGGIEVLKYIRGKEELRGVKILVVSAMPQAKLNEALKAGADGVLRKPFEPEVLVNMVCELAGVPLQ